MTEEYKRRTYEDLSGELQEIYPAAARAFELIPLMYNRLTLVDGLAHKNAVKKIISDHQHLSGFSMRNIRRYLPLDNPVVPKRVRPSWPKSSPAEISDPSGSSITEQENASPELDHQNDTITSYPNDNQRSIIEFEFSLPWNDVHRHMGLQFKGNGNLAKVWFNGRIDIRTGSVMAASVGGKSKNE